MKIQIVNENDEIIDSKERGTLLDNDIYRVSALWIINSKDDILLAKRANSKVKDPGLWGPGVAGTVEENETYESNIIKEAEEELGIEGYHFKLGPKTRTTEGSNHFTQWFILVIDKPLDYFKIQEEEVDSIKWFTKEELNRKMEESPDKFIKSFLGKREMLLNLT
jgi:isopentenyldiphosphate isomerase